jgi:hypothetical protein
MELFERARSLADQATARAKESVEEAKLMLELRRAYDDLGKTTFELVDGGDLEHPRLQPLVDRIRTIDADLKQRRQGSGTTSEDTASTGEASPPPG